MPASRQGRMHLSACVRASSCMFVVFERHRRFACVLARTVSNHPSATHKNWLQPACSCWAEQPTDPPLNGPERLQRMSHVFQMRCASRPNRAPCAESSAFCSPSRHAHPTLAVQALLPALLRAAGDHAHACTERARTCAHAHTPCAVRAPAWICAHRYYGRGRTRRCFCWVFK